MYRYQLLFKLCSDGKIGQDKCYVLDYLSQSGSHWLQCYKTHLQPKLSKTKKPDIDSPLKVVTAWWKLVIYEIRQNRTLSRFVSAVGVH